MTEYITICILAIALSMDAFSISLSIGTLELSSKKHLIISLTIGIFHFFMPLIGVFFGDRLINIIQINPDILLSIVLMIIIIGMIKGIASQEEQKFKFNILEILILAFGVSFDSFSTGIGLITITNKIYRSAILFSFFSFSFTIIGLSIGKYSKQKIGSYADIIGIILLLGLILYRLIL